MNALRSFPLQSLATHLAREDIKLVSLQAVHGTDELSDIPESISIYQPLLRKGDDQSPRSIDEMVSIISCLDLVITCDSLCAHLAAGLGIETWLLLAKVPDWRWGLESIYTAWYDNMRLFRQTRHGDWNPVFTQVGNKIAAKLSTSPQTLSLTERAYTIQENASQTDWIETVNARHGKFSVLKNDIYIAKSMLAYGEYSEHEIELFRKILTAGNVAIEVGANIGAHTVPLGHIVGRNGRLYAFEPQALIFTLLQDNITQNDLTQVTAHQLALGDTLSQILVPRLDPKSRNNFGGISLNTDQYVPETSDQIAVSTVDALALDTCQLIKADVEGMELQVVKGAIETIQRCNPYLYLENDRKNQSTKLVSFVKQLGYRVFAHVPPLYNPNNYLGNQKNLFGDIRSLNILCVPHGKPPLIEPLPEI